MLAYFLATVMATVSLILYLNAFIRPKIHRQDDFLWSGLGLFYSLTLWICSGRITGAVLLGQVAIISVAIAFIWENRQLRKIITAETQSNDESKVILEGVSVLSFIVVSLGKLSQLTKKKSSATDKPQTDKSVKDSPKTEVIEEIPEKENKNQVSDDIKTEIVSMVEEIVTDKDTVEKIENIIEETVNNTLTEKSPQTENIIEKVITPETKKDNITPSSDKLNIEDDNVDDDDFDIDSLGLTQSLSKNKPSSSEKNNIFTKFLNIFRKSPPKEIFQPEELISSSPSLEDENLVKEIPEIDSNITAIEVEDAIANFDLSESNNISENSQTDNETLIDAIEVEKEETVNVSIQVVTSITETIVDNISESEILEEDVSLLTEAESEILEEDVSLLTEAESEILEEEDVSLLTEAESEILEEEDVSLMENTDLDLSLEINPENIPQEDIIESLDDLDFIETENVSLDLESSSPENSAENDKNLMDELDSLFEDENNQKNSQD